MSDIRKSIENAIKSHSYMGLGGLKAVLNVDAYAINVAPLIAERDRLAGDVERLTKERDALKTERKETANEILAHMSSEADFFINYVHSVGDTLKFVSGDRDRLAAEVERLKGELSDMRGIADQTAADSRGNFNAACREGKRAAVAEAALQRIGMSLGSTDEWTDQATMIADVEGRVAAMKADVAKAAIDRLWGHSFSWAGDFPK